MEVYGLLAVLAEAHLPALLAQAVVLLEDQPELAPTPLSFMEVAALGQAETLALAVTAAGQYTEPVAAAAVAVKAPALLLRPPLAAALTTRVANLQRAERRMAVLWLTRRLSPEL